MDHLSFTLVLYPQSGKRVVLLRLPPLETVRAPLNAHSLSTSRTARLLLLFLLCSARICVFHCQFSVVELLAVSHSPFRFGMNVLMTEQMNQYQIAVTVFAPKRSGQQVVNL